MYIGLVSDPYLSYFFYFLFLVGYDLKFTIFFSVTGKDGVDSEVTTGGRYQINLATGELLIVTTVTADSAMFYCNASNSQGSVNAEAHLNVYRKFFF